MSVSLDSLVVETRLDSSEGNRKINETKEKKIRRRKRRRRRRGGRKKRGEDLEPIHSENRQRRAISLARRNSLKKLKRIFKKKKKKKKYSLFEYAR